MVLETALQRNVAVLTELATFVVQFPSGVLSPVQIGRANNVIVGSAAVVSSVPLNAATPPH
eukprot:1047377-Lingulodinium_polyedra.AAC.1